MSTTNFTMLARNRRRLTQQAINSLMNARINVTILDDRSDEDVATLLRGYGAIRNDNPMGTGELRNSVARFSERIYGRRDYLYLSDNDVYFYPGWLQTLINCYEKGWTDGYRILGAYNHPYHRPISEFYCGYAGSSGQYNGCFSINEVNHLASQSILMRWSVWDEFGPFIETPIDKVCQSEDVVFSNKVREAGYKVGVVSPALVVNTGITNSFGEKIPGWELVKSQCPEGVICE